MLVIFYLAKTFMFLLLFPKPEGLGYKKPLRISHLTHGFSLEMFE